MMKKRLLIICIFAGMHAWAQPYEGMWPPYQIGGIEMQMKEAGLKIRAADIYSPTELSLSDAVVRLGTGGTAAMISDKGLMITCYHCAYSNIKMLSGEGQDYVKGGFVARAQADELPVPGQKAAFLIGIEDVTEHFMAYYLNWDMDGLAQAMQEMEANHNKAGLEAHVKAHFGGNRIYLYMYKVYEDVRLVLAPPEELGNFGGRRDEFGWPLHKLEFALYRVYADAQGKAATYSPDNVPLKPEKHLKLRADAPRDGEFVMCMGYPGQTERYLSWKDLRRLRDEKIKRMDGLNKEDGKTKGELDYLHAFIGDLTENTDSLTRKAAFAEYRKQWPDSSAAFITYKYLNGLLADGEVIYPDATGDMRLSYGPVAGYMIRDGVWNMSHSHIKGLLAKAGSGDQAYRLAYKTKALLEKGPGTCLCFMADLDVTGGNSGSPCMDAEGCLVGVLYDINMEAIAGDYAYDEWENRATSVSAESIIFYMKELPGAFYMLEELSIVKP